MRNRTKYNSKKTIERELNKIYNTDCLEFMAKMEDKSVDLVIADPPYEIATGGGGVAIGRVQNKTSLNKISNGFNIEAVLNECERLCKRLNAFIFCSNKQISKLMSWGETRGYSAVCLVWHKPNAIPFTNGTYKSDLEYCIHIRAKGALCQGKGAIKSKLFTRNCQKSQFGHPTEKPLELIQKFILIGSNENDVVFDPFMGSGTTAVACKELGRNFIGCEIEAKYCQIAEKRVANTQKGLFDEI
ncbi:site-specific DNA-methyltransferase [Campylobacter sp. 9BO]|uniref:DNA-methyltransferase n=1 Tax=Campylobacter sp. 9BO TaxID=3424759 RepID=UPI003D33DC3F